MDTAIAVEEATEETPSTTPEESAAELASIFDAGAGVESDEEKSDGPSFGDFSFSGGDDAREPEAHDDAPKPKRKYTRRRKMGPTADPEIEALFTEAGIGAVAASGLDAFFRVCTAPPMSPEEKRHMEKVVAYYAQQRMPKEASKYQPEILLGMMLAFIVVPRLGPIASKTEPVWRPVFGALWGGVKRITSRVFSVFRRGDNAE